MIVHKCLYGTVYVAEADAANGAQSVHLTIHESATCALQTPVSIESWRLPDCRLNAGFLSGCLVDAVFLFACLLDAGYRSIHLSERLASRFQSVRPAC